VNNYDIKTFDPEDRHYTCAICRKACQNVEVGRPEGWLTLLGFVMDPCTYFCESCASSNAFLSMHKPKPKAAGARVVAHTEEG
jgi:hypothetical protein